MEDADQNLRPSYATWSAHAGTFHWQAPETIVGLKTSFSADIWSFGVLLLEIITGEEQRRGFYVHPT